MDSTDYICDTWEIRNHAWCALENLTWNEVGVVCHVINTFVNVYGDKPRRVKKTAVKKELKKLKKEEKEVLIKVLCTLKGKESLQEKKNNKKDIQLTVEDMEFIVEKIVKVTVTFI